MSVNAGKQRNRSNITLVWVICGILSMMAMTPLLSTAKAVPENPGWEEGESWALGYEEDLSFDFDYEELLNELIDDAFEMEESELEDFTVNSEGIVGMYIISEVVETSPQYKIKTTTSFGLDWKITFEITGQFYREGHYKNVSENEEGDWDVPKERQTMTMILDCEAALLAHGFEYRDAQSLAILKQTYSMETAGKATLRSVNWISEDEGEWDYNWETGEETLETLDVQYNDISTDWSWEAEADIRADYSPGIESQPPSENIGDLWNLTYSVTTSGTYDGYVKISLDGNLPDMEMDSFLNYERFDLRDPMLNSPPFVNGDIQETTEWVTLQQEIVGKEYVTMPDGSSVECIVYKEHDREGEYDDEYDNESDDDSDDDSGYGDGVPTSYYFYSPTNHRIVRFQTEYLSEDELVSNIPYSSMNLTPETVSQAQEFNKRYANPSAIGKSEDSSLNYFFISGIIIVISFVGIGAFMFTRRRSSGSETGNSDAFNQPYGTGQTMGQGHAPSPGTFQQPIQSGYQPGGQLGYQPQFQASGQAGNQTGGQNGYQSEYQAGGQNGYQAGGQQMYQSMGNQSGQQNAQCPWCSGTAVYYPSHNQYFCNSCQRPVPVQTAQQPVQGQVNQYQQKVPASPHAPVPTPPSPPPPHHASAPSHTPSSAPPPTSGMWECPGCGNRLEGRFTFCLNCGFNRGN